MVFSERTAVASANGGDVGASILVVDDDPGIVGLLELALGDEGYQVQAAGNGRDALDKVTQSQPDLILLDMNMPVMDGWEFCANMRSRGNLIPIVVMTATRDASARTHDLGAQGFLGKPFDIDQLLQMIDELL